jgi:hypothetical protein
MVFVVIDTTYLHGPINPTSGDELGQCMQLLNTTSVTVQRKLKKKKEMAGRQRIKLVNGNL